MIMTNSVMTGCRRNAKLTICYISKSLASNLKFLIVIPSILVLKNMTCSIKRSKNLFLWVTCNFPPYSQQFHKYLVHASTWLGLPHLVHLVDGWSHHIWWQNHQILSFAVLLESSHTSATYDIPKSWCHKLHVATS